MWFKRTSSSAQVNIILGVDFSVICKSSVARSSGVPEVSQPYLVSILGNPTWPALGMGLVTEEAGQKLSMWLLHSCIPQLRGCQLTPAPGLKGGQSAEAPVPEVTICPAAYPSLQQRDWVSEEQYSTTTWDITWDISMSRPRHAFWQHVGPLPVQDPSMDLCLFCTGSAGRKVVCGLGRKYGVSGPSLCWDSKVGCTVFSPQRKACVWAVLALKTVQLSKTRKVELMEMVTPGPARSGRLFSSARVQRCNPGVTKGLS